MSLKEIVKYDLDETIPIYSPVLQNKMGVTNISNGLEIELGELLTILFDHANKKNIVNNLLNDEKIVKDKKLFLIELYKEHLKNSLPLMYYLNSLDNEIKNLIISTYVLDLNNLHYSDKGESAIFQKILGRDKGFLYKTIEESKHLIDSKSFLDYLNKSIELDIRSGYILIFKLLDPDLPIFKNLSFPNIDVFSDKSFIGKIKTLSNIEKFTPLIYDLFISESDKIQELSNMYDMNIEDAFNETLNKLNVLNIDALNFSDCRTILNVYLKSKNPRKKELMLSFYKVFFKNFLSEPYLPTYTSFNFIEILNNFTENKEGLELIKQIPKNILTSNLILEKNDNVFYFNVDNLIKIIKIKINDRGFLNTNNERNIVSDDIEVLAENLFENKFMENDLVFNLELNEKNRNSENSLSQMKTIVNHLQTILDDEKFKILIKALKDNNIQISIEDIESEVAKDNYGLVQVKIENPEYKKIVINCFKSYLTSDKEQIKEIVDSLSEAYLMSKKIDIKNKNSRKVKKF